jgi:heme exporter protein A
MSDRTLLNRRHHPRTPRANRAAEPLPRHEQAVALSGVTRVFGVVPALVRVNLVVERGETLLIRGPNGSGKSTLLRVIGTVISPTYGSGRVLGFDLVRERESIRRRSEFIGHRTRLYEDLTATENLLFTCALFGLNRRCVASALERVGLLEAAGERVRGYSQGMRQRLALARAVLRSPELMLLDEPYAGLDTQARAVVDDAVVESRRDGRTVVLATHDPTRGGFATRTLEMRDGEIRDEAEE